MSILKLAGFWLGWIACVTIDTIAVRRGIISPWNAAFWETAYIIVMSAVLSGVLKRCPE